MTPDDWQQAKALFHSALALAPGEREAFLDEACQGQDSLRREVEALIKAHEQTVSFIDSPAYKRAEEILPDEEPDLKAGRRVGAYEIISLLGRGGMGEVYLAHDTRLQRKVALKFLPASFARDTDRFRRFEREAQAASALNHPNILTIHEIGEADSLHFIATEFVEGETLRQHLSHTKLNVIETLRLATQLADALEAAHKAGIVHRDIKPENIMLRPDGYVKILDFGLAKLIQQQSSTVDSQAPTQAQFNTSPGLVIGTAQYMSPEQARGLRVDARTDIWSLGVVLHEMVAGRAPFAGKTASDVIVSVLDREPLPLTAQTTGETIPDKLEWIVEKALRKDPEVRYQTIKELRGDLSSLKRQLERESEQERSVPPASGEESLTLSEGRAPVVETELLATRTGKARAARSTAGGEASAYRIRGSRKGLLIGLAVVVLVLAGISFAIYKIGFQRPPSSQSSPSAPFQTMKISRLTSVGKATDAAISPDGKYVVYVLDDAGRQSLWLRHVPTNSDKQIAAPAGLSYRGLIFSHDGNYIYFIGSREETTEDGLYQVTVLGGDLRKVSGNVGSSASNPTKVLSLALSPDNQRVTFARRLGEAGSTLVVMKTDGTGERALLKRGVSERIFAPGWSPDGKTIVCSIASIPAGFSFKLFEVNVEDGQERQLAPRKWWGVGRIAWLRDGSGFVMTASDQPNGLSQVWFISYPDGQARRITNDLNDYYDVSLTADSGTLVAVQSNEPLNLSIAPNGDASHARSILSSDSSISDPSWTPDNRIVFDSMTGGKRAVWIMDGDGNNRKQLASVADVSQFGNMTRDLRYITFQAYSGETFNVWRMDSDGSNLKQLTEDGGVLPVPTPDNKWIIYFKLTPAGGQILRVPIEGGASVPITDETVNAISPIVSPDGKWIACSYSSPKYRAATPGAVFRTAVIPFEGGEPVKVFDLLGGPENDYGWSADSNALDYIVTRDGVSNIWRQPLDGGKPVQLTDFKTDQIYSFDWSRDGRQLLILRGTATSDVVILNDLK